MATEQVACETLSKEEAAPMLRTQPSGLEVGPHVAPGPPAGAHPADPSSCEPSSPNTPTFSLGSFDSGLRVLHSSTVRLVELQQGSQAGRGSPRAAEAAAAPGGGSSFKQLVTGLKLGAVKKPFQPEGRLLGKRYLLQLTADSLQLFRPTNGGNGLRGAKGPQAEAAAEAAAEAEVGESGSAGEAGRESSSRRSMAVARSSAASPLRLAKHLAGKLAAGVGSASSQQAPPQEAAAAGSPSRVTAQAVAVGGQELQQRPAVIAQPVLTGTRPPVAAEELGGRGGQGQESTAERGGGTDVKAGSVSDSEASSVSEEDEAGGSRLDGLLTLGVTLAQVTSIEQLGRQVHVAYHPNHPQRRSTVKVGSKAVARGLFFPIGYPVRTMLRGDSDVKAYFYGRREEQGECEQGEWEHGFTVQASTEQEASALAGAIMRAMGRLSEALHWLDLGLPLESAPHLIAVTAEQQASSQTSSGSSGSMDAGGASNPRREVIAMLPQWGRRVALPQMWSQAVSAAVGSQACPAGPAGPAGTGRSQHTKLTHFGRGRSAAGTAGGGGGLGGEEVGLAVWLGGPLGSAVAKLGRRELQALCRGGGGRPTMVQAAIVQTGGTPKAGAQAAGRLGVLLQCCMHSQEVAPAAAMYEMDEMQAGTAGMLRRQEGAHSAQQMAALLMWALVAVLVACWVQVITAGRSGMVAALVNAAAFAALAAATTATAAVFTSYLNLSALASGVPALPRLPPAAGLAPALPSAPPPAGPSLQQAPYLQWSLVLLSAQLVDRELAELPPRTLLEAGAEREEGEEEMKEEVAEEEEAAVGREAGKAAIRRRLPHALRELLHQFSGVLDEDTAERFLLSYPSHHKAYAALKESAEWRVREGLVGILEQPHPKFAAIKRHHPHGVYSMSSKAGCLVWVEKDGMWSGAYERLKAEGVTDTDLLRHLVLCYDFNFQILDPRPHPYGRTIFIADTAGLRMGDGAGEAFRVITRVSTMLNLNYPDRLEHAFVVNTPGWFSLIWRMVSPMIAKETRERIQIFSKKEKAAMHQALLEMVEPECLPREYGGTATTPLHDTPYERRLQEHVQSVLQHAQAQV